MGVRFTTLQDAATSNNYVENIPPSSLENVSVSHRFQSSQPPTTITALLNPITGHILTAYTARVSSNLALSSRYAFNINSYESEWTMGAEWCMRGKDPNSFDTIQPQDSSNIASSEPTNLHNEKNTIRGVVKARISTSAVNIISFFIF